MNKVISGNISETNKSPYIIFKGLSISVIITLISIFIFAVIITFTEFPESSIAPVIIGITAISILVRNINIKYKTKQKWYD